MTSPAVERHPHLAEPVPAGWVRVDMHSHTMWSGDCTTTPEELVAAVANAGIEVLCITARTEGAYVIDRILAVKRAGRLRWDTIWPTGPGTISQISLMTSLNWRPDLATSDGLVVTPSKSPIS